MIAREQGRATTEAAALGRRLRCVGGKMQACVEARLEDADISFTQWKAMRAIADAGECGTCALAADLAITMASTSRIVAGLESRGLVSRERIAGERNATRLTLTSAGHARLREVAPIIERRMAEALAGLADGELATLMTLLGRLAHSIDGVAACQSA